MPASRPNLDSATRPLSNVVLENTFLRVQVLPEAGGRIWQITHKPSGTDLLWNNPQLRPSLQEPGASYDDNWSGGWDDLFPNDEAAVIAGRFSPDHGELWTGSFAIVAQGSQSLHLEYLTPVSCVFVEKSITLSPTVAQITLNYRFTNRGDTPLPFLWKLHPAMAVSPAHRIDLPAMQVDLEPDFLGTLEQAPMHFPWPHVPVNGTRIDLRRVPPEASKQVYLLYGHSFKNGWCALTNTNTGLACGLRFDPKVFSSCWLFASYGGWNGHNVAVLEPCTGYPLHFDEMVRRNLHRVLEPRTTLQSSVLFTVQEGLHSVGEVLADGTLVEAETD